MLSRVLLFDSDRAHHLTCCVLRASFAPSAVGEVSIDVSKMMANKAKAVKGLTGGIESLFKKYKVTYVKGFGRIAGPQSISVDLLDGGKQAIEASKIIIATGSEVSPLPPVPVDNAGGKIVDSTGALDLKEIPKSLAVIGGGVIGLEMGSVWRRLGAKVTVIEFLDRIVPATDLETGRNFLRTLKKQGFDFKLSTKVVASQVTKDGVKLKLEAAQGGNAEDFVADVVLVSTGRRPFTKGFGLEELGVNMDRLGRIQVNENFQTNVPSIYAIGDCIEGPMLAHKAEEEGIACVENFAGFAGHVNYDAIPSVVYTHPELATVGKCVSFACLLAFPVFCFLQHTRDFAHFSLACLCVMYRTEEQLKEAGIQYNKGTFPFAANSRARAVNDSEGSIKVLSDKETDRILGVHIIGPNAGEMIAEVR